MTEPTYGGLTASQLWQAIAEAGAGEVTLSTRVMIALLREIERLTEYQSDDE